MPISPVHVQRREPSERDYQNLLNIIDKFLASGKRDFDLIEFFDTEAVMNTLILDYRFAGWSLTWFPCNRIVRYKDRPTQRVTKTLSFRPLTQVRRPNARLTGRR